MLYVLFLLNVQIRILNAIDQKHVWFLIIIDRFMCPKPDRDQLDNPYLACQCYILPLPKLTAELIFITLFLFYFTLWKIDFSYDILIMISPPLTSPRLFLYPHSPKSTSCMVSLIRTKEASKKN